MSLIYNLIHDSKKRAVSNLDYANELLQIQIQASQKLGTKKAESETYGSKFLDYLPEIAKRFGQLKLHADNMLVLRKECADISRKIESKLQKVMKEIESLTKKANGKKQQQIESYIRIQQQQKTHIEKELQMQYQQMQQIEEQSISILEQFFSTFKIDKIESQSKIQSIKSTIDLSFPENSIEQQSFDNNSYINTSSFISKEPIKTIENNSSFQRQSSFDTEINSFNNSYDQISSPQKALAQQVSSVKIVTKEPEQIYKQLEKVQKQPEKEYKQPEQNYQQEQQYNDYQSPQPAYSQEAALNQFEQQTQQNAYATAEVTYEEQLAAEWEKQQSHGQQQETTGHEW